MALLTLSYSPFYAFVLRNPAFPSVLQCDSSTREKRAGMDHAWRTSPDSKELADKETAAACCKLIPVLFSKGLFVSFFFEFFHYVLQFTFAQFFFFFFLLQNFYKLASRFSSIYPKKYSQSDVKYSSSHIQIKNSKVLVNIH